MKPPKGVATRTDEFVLIDNVPASSARATRSARPPSPLQIDPDRPYGVSLAMAMASASSSKGTTATTGPNTSSRNSALSGSAGATTVHGNQNPGPLGALPR